LQNRIASSLEPVGGRLPGPIDETAMPVANPPWTSGSKGEAFSIPMKYSNRQGQKTHETPPPARPERLSNF
jgi:hypothetical protein